MPGSKNEREGEAHEEGKEAVCIAGLHEEHSSVKAVAP